MAIDAANKIHDLDDANLAVIAHEAVLRDLVQNGSVDNVRVRKAIGVACGDDMTLVARAMHFAQRITIAS